MGRVLWAMLGLLLSTEVVRAQGPASVPVWERKGGDWTVSLTGGDRRCAMAGTTLAPAHQLRFLLRPGAAPPAPRPDSPARPARSAEVAQRPMLELVENIGGLHVSAPIGTPLSLTAEGRGFGFQVVSAFPGGFRAVATTDFSMAWASAREVFLVTGMGEPLRLSPTGLSVAGAAMTECLAGRVPR